MLVKSDWQNVVGYCRVTSDSKTGKSELLVQRSILEQFGEIEGVEYCDIFEEVGEPGVNLDDVYNCCLECGCIDYLVVFDFESISTDAKEVEAVIHKFLGIGTEIVRVRECPLESSISNRCKKLLDSLEVWRGNGWDLRSPETTHYLA